VTPSTIRVQASVASHVLDEEKAAPPKRPERELEQPFREIRVRSFEAPRGGRGQSAALAQVDGDVAAGGQLRDPLDRSLEGVREGELGDRLAHEAERLRQNSRTVPVGKERETLLRKARQLETASHIDEWLSSPGLQTPH